jgi:hypothetical protein
MLAKGYLIGHMPMGFGDSRYGYSEYFDQIVQQCNATMAALFYVHTHRDNWEISYSDNSNQNFQTATEVSYIAPALTPTSGNPPFRVFSIDPITFGVLDYTAYYTNMSSSNYQADASVWETYYPVKETYSTLVNPPYTSPSAELAPASWHNLTEVFENDDSIFRDRYARKQQGYDPVLCTDTYKTEEICRMGSSQSQYACLPEGNPASIKKHGKRKIKSGYSDGSCSSTLLCLFREPRGQTPKDFSKCSKTAERSDMRLKGHGLHRYTPSSLPMYRFGSGDDMVLMWLAYSIMKRRV